MKPTVKIAISILFLTYLLILYKDPITMGFLTFVAILFWAIREVCIHIEEKLYEKDIDR